MLEPSPEDPRRFQPKVRFDGSGIEFEAVCLITWDINLLLIAVQPFEAHLPAADMAMAPYIPPSDLKSYTSRNPNFQFICEVDQRSGFDRAAKVTATGRLTNKKDHKDFFDDACFFQKCLPKDLDDTTRMPYDD